MKLIKRIALLSIFTIFLISCSDNDSILVSNPVIENEFNVMSYNISGSTFTTHKDSIISLIHKNNIDVLGLQELSGFIKPEFMSLLGTNFSLVETFPSDINKSTHNIVYNNETFSMEDFGYFETDLCGPRRFINWVLLKKLDNNTRYYVYNNHLCNSNLEMRKQHLVDLVNIMEIHQIQTGTDYKAIITGDFNSGENTEFIQFILGNNALTIGSDTFVNPVTIIDTWNTINTNILKPSQGNVAIDWIFATPDLEVISSLVDLSGVNVQGQFPSEHSPVITKFK